MPKSTSNRCEGTSVPCCAICTKRAFTDWRPDYQKYMCDACVEITPSPLSRILASQGRSRRRRAARGGEFCGVEIEDDFYSPNNYY